MPSYENQFTLGIKRLFLLAYEGGDNRVTADFHKRHYVARVEIKIYKFEIDGGNFYGQPIDNQEINNLIKHYDELRETWIGQGDDYTTGCLLNFFVSKKVLD